VVIMDVDPDGAIAVLAGDKKMRQVLDATPAGIPEAAPGRTARCLGPCWEDRHRAVRAAADAAATAAVRLELPVDMAAVVVGGE